MTRNGMNNLNYAILNVARKLKLERVKFWEVASYSQGAVVKRLDDMTIDNNIDLLIDLSNRLYHCTSTW